jgi:hypothetical protein
MIGTQSLSHIINCSRVQSVHFNEVKKEKGFENKEVKPAFEALENDFNNPVFADYLKRAWHLKS